MLAALAFVALVYIPIRHSGFVWDDVTSFVENDWLRGSDWAHYLLRDFHGWTNYFRPLGVALFTLEARLFDNMPGPMHVVSIVLHLVATALVWRVAETASAASSENPPTASRLSVVAALVFGLHPALVEPVAWIAAQFELLLVVSTLFAFWAAIAMQSRLPRALVLATAFFAAACSKETAVVVPLLVLLFDWAWWCRRHQGDDRTALRIGFFRRNTVALVAMLLAGIAYLAFRYYGLGHLLHAAPMYGGDLPPLGKLQKVASTLIGYVRMLFVPAGNLDAVHSFAPADFATPRLELIAFIILAVCGIAWAVWQTIRRGTPAATACLMFFVALVPVLNLVPVGFAVSLFHERFVMLALACLAVMAPSIRWPVPNALPARARSVLGCLILVLWIAMSILTIRATLPRWSNDEALWRATILRNQDNEIVQYNLVVALLRGGRTVEADQFSERFARAGNACARCDIETASRRLDEGEVGRASILLSRAGSSARVAEDLNVAGQYLLISGQLALAESRPADAVNLLSRSAKLRPTEIIDQVLLAEAQLATGDANAAMASAATAIVRSSPSQRPAVSAWRTELESRARGSNPSRRSSH